MASHIPGCRMRSACNPCHFAKLRCSGGSPCANCQMSNHPCVYSLSSRLGRPKGVKNKRAASDSARATSTRSNLQETTPKRPATNGHDVSTTASADPEGMADLNRLVHANYPVLPDELDLFTAFAAYPNDLPLPLHRSASGYVTPSNSIHDDVASLEVSGRCICAQQHADLLSHLRAMRQQPAPISVDALLAAGQRTLATWKHFSQCLACSRPVNEETMLLSAISLRSMLRLLQAFSYVVTEHPVPTSLLSPSLEDPDGPLSMTIGGYQIEGDERHMVGNMLALHTLNRIEFAVSCLAERVASCTRPGTSSAERMPAKWTAPDDSELESDLQPVQVILQGMETAIRKLSQALQWKHRAATMKMYGGMG
ncbi:hypothetical protein N7474_002585 [Penicillium riverlandense]|uniref:uncharacterized protein n=1 Tax=Penicillium riverlandense TaxID=1903569 RepID=UPI002548BD32|nr:uncharacterized protein N7474_002585 [Penicillium riverlandense]KAJ5825447.1 hypothetical protein N7474_002585 [Penicillium riverlandense]